MEERESFSASPNNNEICNIYAVIWKSISILVFMEHFVTFVTTIFTIVINICEADMNVAREDFNKGTETKMGEFNRLLREAEDIRGGAHIYSLRAPILMKA